MKHDKLCEGVEAGCNCAPRAYAADGYAFGPPPPVLSAVETYRQIRADWLLETAESTPESVNTK